MRGKIKPLVLVLALCLAQVPLLGFEPEPVAAQAEQEPLWSYDLGQEGSAIAISASGSYIAVGGADIVRKVYLFGRSSNTPLWSYQTGGAVSHVSISSDGSYIVAGSNDNSIYLFSSTNNTPIWSYQAGASIGPVAISSDGNYIVAGGGDDHKFYFFSRASSTPLWIYDVGDTTTRAGGVSISSDGSYIVASQVYPNYSVSTYQRLYLFSKTDNTPLWSYQPSGAIFSVSISSDGSYIAAGGSYSGGSTYGRVYLFSKDSSTPLWSYETGDVYVNKVAISSDGNYIVAGARDKKIYLFTKDSGTPLWSYQTGGEVSGVSISSDGSYIAGGSYDHKVYPFTKTDNTPLWSYSTGYAVGNVVISSDGGYIAGINCQTNIGKVHLFSSGPTNTPSIASFTYSPSSPTTDNTIQFTDTSTDNDGTIASRSWDFGNGTTSTLQNPTHQYSSAGMYTVTLTVTDNGGLADNASQIITVSAPPVPGQISTTLSISPSSFTLQSGNSTTLTATLKDNANNALAGKSISLSATTGSLSATSGATDSYGQTSVAYTAPTVTENTSTTITASFAGDNDYGASSGNSSCTITAVVPSSTTLSISPASFSIYSGQTQTLAATLKDDNNNAIANKTVAWSATAGSLSTSGTTNILGQVSVTYTAPTVTSQTTITITASFAGDASYQSSSSTSSGTVSPTPTVGQEMIVNGNFSTGDATGWTFAMATGSGPAGAYQIVNNAARIYRSGAGSYGRGCWLYQDHSVDVSNATSLTLSFNVKVDYHSLSGLGYADEEPPAYVQILYRDVNGQERYFWRGFYYTGTSSNPNAEKISQSTWVSRSYDLTSLSPKPATIKSAYVVASGWDYDSSFDNVSLTYTAGVTASTSLSISPSSFTLGSGGSTTLTATLTSGGSPLAGKTVTWSATPGSISPSNGTTNSSGQVTATYTAPTVTTQTSVTITASFAGDASYQSSSGSSTGTINPSEKATTTLNVSPSSFIMGSGGSTTLTATLTSGGSPLAGKTIAWSTVSGSLSSSSGTTNASGQCSVVYTAPTVSASTLVTVTASFAGDNQYQSSAASSAGTIAKTSTDLVITPSAFTLQPGGSTTLTAMLTSNGAPLVGKTLAWSTSSGSVTLSSGSTGSLGQVTATYTAPSSETTDTITASFAGDNQYQSSTATSSGKIVSISAQNAVVDIKPDTLQIGSLGQWVTCYIELPDDNVEQIDVSSILLEGAIQVDLAAPTEIGDYDNDGAPDLIVKFDRLSVENIVVPGLATLTVTGSVGESDFIGSDTIDVIKTPPGAQAPGALASVRREKPDEEPEVKEEVYDPNLGISTEVGDNRVTVTVGSEVSEGKTVVVNVDNNVLSLSNMGEIKVLFDNEEIALADDYADVFDTTDENTAEYLVLLGAKGVQLLVSIPSFSTHTITITSAAAPSAQLPTQPFVAAPPMWVIVVAAITLVAVLIAVIWRYLSVRSKEISKGF